MRISEINDKYNEYLAKLKDYRTELVKKQEESKLIPNNTRETEKYEKEIDKIDKGCDAVQKYLDSVNEIKTNQDKLKSGNEEMQERLNEIREQQKCLEIFRRISTGGSVPTGDVQKLMLYSKEMYSVAKVMALMNMKKTQEKYDSIYNEEMQSPMDILFNQVDSNKDALEETDFPELNLDLLMK